MKRLVDWSLTFQRLATTEGVPAYIKARVSPIIPSPRRSFPLPVSQPEGTTRPESPASFLVGTTHIEGHGLGYWGCLIQGIAEGEQRSLRGHFFTAIGITVFLKRNQHGGRGSIGHSRGFPEIRHGLQPRRCVAF